MVKLTDLYNKERRRIKQFIKRAEKRGYIFPKNALPKIPKTIKRESLNRLKNITPKQLYKKAKYKSPLSDNKIVSGEEGRRLERKESARKAQQTRKRNKEKKNQNTYRNYQHSENRNTDEAFYADAIINGWKANVTRYNLKASHIMLNWIELLILNNGKRDVAKMLQEGAQAGIIVTWEVMYKSTAMRVYIASMMDYLPDPQGYTRDEILDAFDDNEFEYNEAEEFGWKTFRS